MAYYVRRIARAKWTLLDKSSDEVIENYRADAIANDMRTFDNTLSFWRAESMDPEDFEPVIVINSLLGDNIKKLDLLCIPEESLLGFDLVQVDGNTIVYEYKGLHYNLVSLTIKRLIDFARDIVLNELCLVDSHPEYIWRVTENQQYELIENWLLTGKISFDDLKKTQKENIIKYREKKAQFGKSF